MSEQIERNEKQLPQGDLFNSEHIERAIRDAEKLVDYAARTNRKLDPHVFKTLVGAKKIWQTEAWTEDAALAFWEAFRQLNQTIGSTTIESVRAINRTPRQPGWRGFLQDQYGRSEAGRAITRYTVWTLLVLAVVLILQIYWVIGNSLTVKLTELLEKESNLTTAIRLSETKYDELEVLFKLKETEDEPDAEVNDYGFYDTPDWERETLRLAAERDQLTQDLQTLKIQLERNFSILESWAFIWDESVNANGLVNDTIEEKIEQIEGQIEEHDKLYDEQSFKAEIEAKEAELVTLDADILVLEARQAELAQEGSGEVDPTTQQEAQAEGAKNVVAAKLGDAPSDDDPFVEVLREEITAVTTQRTAVSDWLAQNTMENFMAEKEKRLVELTADKAALLKEHDRWVAKERVRRLRLSADFVLVILQSYLLPVLYGLLGASVFVLRKLMSEIKNQKYNPDRSYLLRLALGTLSGLIIGWFVFLLPGQSVIGALPPMALAFLVGYNIDILFAQMDKLIVKFTNGEKGGLEKAKKDGDKTLAESKDGKQPLAKSHA